MYINIIDGKEYKTKEDWIKSIEEYTEYSKLSDYIREELESRLYIRGLKIGIKSSEDKKVHKVTIRYKGIQMSELYIGELREGEDLGYVLSPMYRVSDGYEEYIEDISMYYYDTIGDIVADYGWIVRSIRRIDKELREEGYRINNLEVHNLDTEKVINRGEEKGLSYIISVYEGTREIINEEITKNNVEIKELKIITGIKEDTLKIKKGCLEVEKGIDEWGDEVIRCIKVGGEDITKWLKKYKGEQIKIELRVEK